MLLIGRKKKIFSALYHISSLFVVRSFSYPVMSRLHPNSISKYLTDHVAPALTAYDPSNRYRFYLGNEAADADSIISALCCAYLSYFLDERAGAVSNVHMPLICIPKEEYQLRPETHLLLEKDSFTFPHSTFGLTRIPSLFDLKKDSSFYSNLLSNAENHRFILLDHNSPSEKFLNIISPPVIQSPGDIVQSQQPAKAVKGHPTRNILSQIVEIYDHHQDSNLYTELLPLEKQNIAFDSTTMKPMVGSTCTLIAEKLLGSLDKLTENGFSSSQMQEVSFLLLGVILLDTMNMDPKLQKGTIRDDHAISSLMQVLNADSTVLVNREELFQQLVSAKNNESFWTSISFLNCLKFDYKLFLSENTKQRLGFSSMLLPVSSVLEKVLKQQGEASNSDIVSSFEELQGFYSKENLDYLFLLTFFQGKREIAVVKRGDELKGDRSARSEEDEVKKLHTYLLSRDHHQLNLSEVFVDENVQDLFQRNGFLILAFSQENITFSRKQIAPILCQFL
jgi:inorganic pyrophosphatase/exopolyphosphatase